MKSDAQTEALARALSAKRAQSEGARCAAFLDNKKPK